MNALTMETGPASGRSRGRSSAGSACRSNFHHRVSLRSSFHLYLGKQRPGQMMSASAVAYCAEQVRRYDIDRFLCTLFAPPAEREALWSIYAFNLELARIRESVSQPLLGHIRLRWWMDTLDAVCDGRPPNHPVALAL